MDAPRPEGPQLAAFARWLQRPEIVRKVGSMIPLYGGPRSACECRVKDVAAALLILSVTEFAEHGSPR